MCGGGVVFVVLWGGCFCVVVGIFLCRGGDVFVVENFCSSGKRNSQ